MIPEVRFPKIEPFRMPQITIPKIKPFKMPEIIIPKIKPFKMPEIKMPKMPKPTNSKDGETSSYHVSGSSSSMFMESTNGGKPKISSTAHKVVINNGEKEEEFLHFSN